MNYVSTVVLKQREEFAREREAQAAVRRTMIVMVVVAGMAMMSWVLR